MEYISISQVKRLNQEKGYFFFTDGATRFFRSRYPSYGLKAGDVAYFVTSEQFDEHSPRLYTIRKIDLKTGDVDTIGAFQGYQTNRQATIEMKRIAHEELLKQLQAH